MGDLFGYSPCCTGQKYEVQCSLRHFEKRCLPHKTADAPNVGQSHSGTPFNVKSVIEISTNCQGQVKEKRVISYRAISVK